MSAPARSTAAAHSDNNHDRQRTKSGRSTYSMHHLSQSQSSAKSFNSTAKLVHHDTATHRAKQSWSRRVFLCGRSKRKAKDTEKNDLSPPSTPTKHKAGVDIWMGWRLLFFGSWLNLLILLVPATWILRLAVPDSPTLTFASCILAMIPLVKMHDLSVRELSVRLGGSRTGLLNASMSNIVEAVIAIIALRKCELRVVQSSLIGSMLSKLLLILGMCFFAGGMRFTQQDFDSTATQIHSSLLSLSVGAVLLPAAYHFTLSYRSGENVQETMEEQKKDILRMSHGVSIILVFIYVSYLLFQFWSHSHHFRDVDVPSNKLPNAVSMRSVASRVPINSPTLRRLVSPTPQFSTVFRSPRAPFSTTGSSSQTGPYLYRQATYGSPSKSGILISSPLSNGSEVNIGYPLTMPTPAASTVRLVGDMDRPGGSSEGDSDSASPPTSGKPSPLSSCNGSPKETERISLVSDLVMSYYGDIEGMHERILHPNTSTEALKALASEGTKSRIQLAEDTKPVRHPLKDPEERRGGLHDRQPQLSWFLTLTVLTVVTVLVAVNAEWMIDSIDDLSHAISKEWIALILLPTVGSLAECITATNVSVEDQLTLSISVAVGSTIQTALFVIPFMVLLGWVLDKPLALLFDPFESIVLYIAVHTMGYVVADGKSNWLEGLILIGLYVVAAVSFWFYPGSNFSSTLAVCSTSRF